MSSSPASSSTYRCVIGFNYQPKRGKALRFDAGDPIKGAPASMVPKWAAKGLIIPASVDADVPEGDA